MFNVTYDPGVDVITKPNKDGSITVSAPAGVDTSKIHIHVAPHAIQSQAHERGKCLECGMQFKSLTPHLRNKHDMSAAEYLKKHGIHKRFLTTEEHTETRRAVARKFNLAATMRAGRAANRAVKNAA